MYLTLDRNANAMKKVYNFPQKHRVSASKNGHSAQMGSTTLCVTGPVCAENRKTHIHHKSLVKYQPNVQSLTLTNRFQVLPVEEISIEDFNAHTLDTESPQNEAKGSQLKALGNNISVIQTRSHKNVLSTPTFAAVDKSQSPELTHEKLTKGDPIQSSMTNVTDDTSADHMYRGQLDFHMAFAQTKNVPHDVWENRFHFKDYNECVHQNGDNFGYIPLNDLHIYKGPAIQWNSLPDIWQANKLIHESKVPNFLNCRIPVKTQLNPNNWLSYLTHYWDQQLPDLIQYGFPLDFNRNSNLVSIHVNHTSANSNMVLCMAHLKILLSLCMFLH